MASPAYNPRSVNAIPGITGWTPFRYSSNLRAPDQTAYRFRINSNLSYALIPVTFTSWNAIAETWPSKETRLAVQVSESKAIKAVREHYAKWEARHPDAERNPLFLPKSLFDSYTVRSQGGEVSVDRIQTLSGAEKKVKELAKRYPCVGFDIRSKKFDTVVKSYKPAVGGAPKVDEDNTRSYKREATEAAKANVQFRLDLDGREYGTYDTKKEAQEVGKREGGRVRIKEVVANPYSPSGHSHLSDDEYSDMMHEFYAQIPDPPRPLVKRYGMNYRNRPDLKEIEAADRKVTSTRSRMQREYKAMAEESNRRFHARGNMRNPSKRVVHLFRIHILSHSDNHGMGSANVYTGKGIMDKDGVVASPSWYMGPQSIAVGGPMGVDYTRERMAKKHYHEVDEGGGRVKNPSNPQGVIHLKPSPVHRGYFIADRTEDQRRLSIIGWGQRAIKESDIDAVLEAAGAKMYEVEIQNPLTGQPSHDIPELRRSGRSQRQSVAIAMSEQRRTRNDRTIPRSAWNPALTGYSVVQSGSVASTIRKTGISNKGTAMEFAKRVSVQVPHLDVFVVKGGEPIAAFKSGKLIKRNPYDSFAASESAEALYESFHGVPPTGEIVYEENHEVPDAYAELGDLVELKVATIHGKDATIAAPDPDSGDLQSVVKLASDPTGRQLYFIGGDQELDLDKMGFAESEERHRMLIGVVYELTYRAKKKFHNLKLTDYYHALGEETGNQPCLTYNPYSCSLGLVGGNYEVRPEGIVD